MTYYAAEAGVDVALDFVDAVETAVGRIEKSPGLGFTHQAGLSGIPDLRSVSLTRFPYSVFFVRSAVGTMLVRVLHAHRDVPVLLQESVEPAGEH